MRFKSVALVGVSIAGLLFTSACGGNNGCYNSVGKTHVYALQSYQDYSIGGGGSHSSFSGSSGARSSSSYSGGSRSYSSGNSGVRSSNSYSSGKPSGVSSGSKSITRSIGGKSVHVVVPSRLGSSYSYGGRTFHYHPESYWMLMGPPNPYNPYDTRNGYNIAYAGSC